MAINLHQLEIFYTVARLEGFSRAAVELSISQPAVSLQVQELEKTLGVALFHRLRRGLQLTDAGSAVFDYAQRIFALINEMQGAIEDLQGLKSGRLTVGSSTTPGEYLLPWAIGQFRQRYPGIEVSLSIANTQVIVERINNRELDLGLVGAPVQGEALTTFPYVSDDIVIIASPHHLLADEPELRPTDLEGQDFILREEGSATRLTAEECLRDLGVSIRVVMELGSNEAVKRAVAAGLGLGVISGFGVTPDTTAGFIKVLQVKGWECRRPLTVVYRRDRHLPWAQRAFLEFLRTEKPLPEVGV